MNLSDIKSVLLINLEKRKDRLQNFEKQIENSYFIKTNYSRYDAIDGNSLCEDEIKEICSISGYSHIFHNKKANGLYLTKGAVGLAKTYKNIFEQCKDTTLILEDDIIIDQNFDTVLSRTLSYMPTVLHWDILYLGWYNSPRLIINKINENISRLSGQINGTQGWVINPNSAQKLLQLFPINYQIDTEIYLKNNLIKYSTSKRIIKKAKFKSDIQN
jgi:GR25 family glycosyltransferase involved in LPS biosynthesis